MDDYRPVDQEIVEELEVLSAMKKLCRLRFEGGNGGISEIRTRVLGVYEDEDSFFLKTESGLPIRLDKLIQIDDKPLKKNC